LFLVIKEHNVEQVSTGDEMKVRLALEERNGSICHE
jgi:hypothetical protein